MPHAQSHIPETPHPRVWCCLQRVVNAPLSPVCFQLLTGSGETTPPRHLPALTLHGQVCHACRRHQPRHQLPRRLLTHAQVHHPARLRREAALQRLLGNKAYRLPATTAGKHGDEPTPCRTDRPATKALYGPHLQQYPLPPKVLRLRQRQRRMPACGWRIRCAPGVWNLPIAAAAVPACSRGHGCSE